ncbi:VOC family protein [Leuconostoc mesenteroides]|uniref:VOC family protein n=1 Tax=Leuconostoc mesenteroides TaxID=1245 RepID=UPI00065E029B|nr:VOC family protein [Leuconostoc mesenteroides]AKP36598.1 glyoxalase [Leuconostoc mesenteroides subsp. dextranicum]MBZ1510304.1 VOC family protein [Leuconostoc mesenteroides]MBZ1524367.1 VOC family protein [Leuconostoc mesenteroides]MCT3048792.1 VOC family protein [Leuconostoc mesenteroides]ORI96092.1 glyoxalase [Leuconostoc mesenteroides subsp. mesenteroides]
MAFADYYSGLQHVGIPSSSLEQSEVFWTKLGFKKTGDFPAGNVIFMQRENLVIETWSGDEVAGKPGAINHISMDTTDADAAFDAANAEGFTLIDSEVQHLPFWDKGIKFFNLQGPDGVIVEFCEIVK